MRIKNTGCQHPELSQHFGDSIEIPEELANLGSFSGVIAFHQSGPEENSLSRITFVFQELTGDSHKAELEETFASDTTRTYVLPDGFAISLNTEDFESLVSEC